MHRFFAVAAFLVSTVISATVIADQYAILIGVKNYDRTELNSLNYTENDVDELAKVLQDGGVDRRRMFVLTQANGARKTRFLPTSENIRREMALVLGNLERGDSVVVAFSGHGVQFEGEDENYFCPADARLGDRDTLISLSSVFDQLEKCKARHKVLLVDACRNDPQSTLSKSGSRIVLEPVSERKPPVIEGGTVAMFSCSASQQSFEDPQIENGVFLTL